MSRQRGTVKWFSRDKGWGFIRLENGDEIFVHHSDVEGDGFVNLADDEPVEFTIEEMEKGPRARNVRSLNGAAGAGVDDARETAAAVAGSERNAEVAPEQRPAAESTRRKDHGASGLRPLAEQLAERLGGRFPGFRS